MSSITNESNVNNNNYFIVSKIKSSSKDINVRVKFQNTVEPSDKDISNELVRYLCVIEKIKNTL